MNGMYLVKCALATRDEVDLSWIDPPPPADGWTLAPDALRMIAKMVELMKPKHVMELGSGLSTNVLARACARHAPGAVISSIDHDPEFHWKGDEARVRFHLAPLVVREFGGKLLGAYLIHRDQLASKEAVDLVVIDGPPVNLGGREGTLYQIMDYAKAGTIVLLDDSRRVEEKAAIKAWKDNLGDAIAVEQLDGFAKGMAAVAIHRPITTRELWRHRFELTRAEIEQVVPRDSAIAIAGESWWAEELRLDRKVIPFTQKDGQYWGEPADDDAAIAEFAKSEARYVAFGWPVFWWVAHYARFVAALGRRVIDNDRLMMFERVA